MIAPWAKRAFIRAAFGALAHSAAWAGYVYHLQRKAYDALEQRQGVIEAIRFNRTGSGAMHTRMPTLVPSVRLLDRPQAPAQEVNAHATTEMASAYVKRHRPGDVVPIWGHRKSGRIVDALAPVAPDFMRYLLILLPTIGLLTFVGIGGIFGHTAHRK